MTRSGVPAPPVQMYDRALCQGAYGPCGLPCAPGRQLCERCIEDWESVEQQVDEAVQEWLMDQKVAVRSYWFNVASWALAGTALFLFGLLAFLNLTGGAGR